MTDSKIIKDKILQNPIVKKEYEKNALQFIIAEMVIKARIKKGMTQEKLAKRIGTKQPSIARVESGDYVPGLDLLNKIAKALDTELIPPKFACLESEENKTYTLQFNYFLSLEGESDDRREGFSGNRVEKVIDSYNSSIN